MRSWPQTAFSALALFIGITLFATSAIAICAYPDICRPSAGACDPAERCPIYSATCPPDAKSTGVCRAAVGDCDVGESCNGVSNACPSNTVKPNGTSCNDGEVCTINDQCLSGAWVGDRESCGNGTVETSCGEGCDDGNTEDGDGCSADCLVEGGGIPVLPEPGLILFAVLLLGTSILILRHRHRSRI